MEFRSDFVVIRRGGGRVDLNHYEAYEGQFANIVSTIM